MPLPFPWRPFFWLTAAALPSLAHATALPDGWQLLPATQQAHNPDLPSVLHIPVLTHDTQVLPQVELVVNLPFSQVLPAVQQALAPLGDFQGDAAEARLANGAVGTEWSQVLMARQPAVKQQMVRQTHLPALEQAVADGALLATEIPARLAQLERQWSLASQTAAHQIPALQAPFSQWTASAEQRHGLLQRAQSTLQVRVMQLDAVLGHTSTAIRLQQTDEWPNPSASLLNQVRRLADFNILSSGPSPRLSRHSVPAALFTPVYNALQALPGASVQLGSHASAWLPATPPPPILIEPQWQRPASAPAVQAVQALAWDRNRFDTAGMRVLADGSVLLVQSYPFALLHWSPADGHTAPRTLWQAPEADAPASHWLLSADPQGRTAYLAGNGHLLRYEVDTRTLTTHPLRFDPPVLGPTTSLRYTPDGSGLPLAYLHQRTGPRATFSQWAPTLPPPSAGAPWAYTQRLAAPRQDVFPGSSRLKPVRWDGPIAQTWVEDPAGLSALDSGNGRLLRTIALPRRFGSANPLDDTGMAQWVPEPLGSARGGWMAVGFVLIDDQQRNPGMHVVDMATGQLRHSLALPGLDALPAAAAAADGQRLALGGNHQGEVAAAVWTLNSGQSVPLQADGALCWDLRQLQWSPDGSQLWGRCANALVQWSLPAWASSPAPAHRGR